LGFGATTHIRRSRARAPRLLGLTTLNFENQVSNQVRPFQWCGPRGLYRRSCCRLTSGSFKLTAILHVYTSSYCRSIHPRLGDLTHNEKAPQVLLASSDNIPFALFVLGGVFGLMQMTKTLPFGAGFEMYALANNLANHGAYANPLLVISTGPSAATPPLYPIFLATLMRLLRNPQFALLPAALASVFANALSAALLPRVSTLFFGNLVPGVFAAILWLMSAQLMPSWDANITICALIIFVIHSSSNLRIAKSLSAGLLAGALFLLNPMSVFVFLPWLAHLLVFRNAPLKGTAAYCSIVLGIAALLVLPWGVRNHHQLGSFVVRTGFGRTIFSSNTDCSKTSLIEDLQSGCAAVYQADFNLKEAMELRDLGEVKYDHQRLAESESWIRANPDRFIHLTLSRVAAFWFPSTIEHPFSASVIWAFTLLSVPGIALMSARRLKATVFIAVVLSIYPLVYYVVVSDVRYRYPVLWLSLLPSGYFLSFLLGRARDRWDWVQR
jgi:hypothetical protein